MISANSFIAPHLTGCPRVRRKDGLLTLTVRKKIAWKKRLNGLQSFVLQFELRVLLTVKTS